MAGHRANKTNGPLLPQDAFYEFRLVAFAGSYISDPSNTVNVSTAGKAWAATHLLFLPWKQKPEV